MMFIKVIFTFIIALVSRIPFLHAIHCPPSSGSDLARLGKVYKASIILLVDVNGCGNFTRVQQAIDAAPQHIHSRTLVVINAGVYREKVTISEEKTNIIIKGRGYQKTIIEWSDTANSSGGTYSSYSFGVFANNFRAFNISFKNTAPQPEPGAVGAQAVAVRIEGDKAAFYGCGFFGAQDTLQDNTGRHFFKGCFIQGSIDFIFGNGRSLYQDCTLRSIAKESSLGINGCITAHGRVSERDKTGFSFVNCRIDGTGKLWLGRAWRPFATVVFSNTYMSGSISKEGWSDLGKGTTDETVYFGENRCYGDGAKSKGRVAYAKQLTDSEASAFTTIKYIDGDQWLND